MQITLDLIKRSIRQLTTYALVTEQITLLTTILALVESIPQTTAPLTSPTLLSLSGLDCELYLVMPLDYEPVQYYEAVIQESIFQTLLPKLRKMGLDVTKLNFRSLTFEERKQIDCLYTDYYLDWWTLRKFIRHLLQDQRWQREGIGETHSPTDVGNLRQAIGFWFEVIRWNPTFSEDLPAWEIERLSGERISFRVESVDPNTPAVLELEEASMNALIRLLT